MVFHRRTITKFTKQKPRHRRRKGNRSQTTSRLLNSRNGTTASSVNVYFHFLVFKKNYSSWTIQLFDHFRLEFAIRLHTKRKNEIWTTNKQTKPNQIIFIRNVHDMRMSEILNGGDWMTHCSFCSLFSSLAPMEEWRNIYEEKGGYESMHVSQIK